MKRRTYLALLRPRTVWFTAPFAFMGVVFLDIAPFAKERVGAQAFATAILLGPLFAGVVLSGAIHAVLHLPNAIVLPALRRTLLRWHLPMLGLLAVIAALVAYRYDQTLPLPVLAGVAFAGLCAPLPMEPGARWFGSRWLFAGVAAVVTGAILAAADTRSVMQAMPVLTVGGSLVFAALCWRITFARERIRARARVSLARFDGPTGSAAYLREMAKFSRSRRLGRSWRIASIGDSKVNWIRAILHERHGCARWGWCGRLVILPLGSMAACLAALLMVRLLPGGTGPVAPFGQFIYQVIWEPQQLRQSLQNLPLIVLGLGLVAASSVAFPRIGYLYPLSREHRARLTFWVSVLQAGPQIPLLLLSLLGLSWISAHLAGVPFHPSGVPNIAVALLALSPLAPAILWLRFRDCANQRVQERGFVNLIGFMVIYIVAPLAPFARAWLLMPFGLAGPAVALAASLLLYRAALLRHYRHADLVNTGTETRPRVKISKARQARPATV